MGVREVVAGGWLLVVGFPGVASAARFDVPAQGAEVCIFKAGPGPNPLTRFLTSTEVTCRPASEDVPIGKETWNVFARRGTDLISDTVESSSVSRPLRLVPAAKIEGDKSLFVYIPRTRSILPAERSIPADTLVVPLKVANGKVAAVGAPITARAGETVRPQFAEARDVIVPVVIRVSPEGEFDVPLVTLRDGNGKAHPSATPLREVAETALVIFRDVPQTANVTLTGARWKTVERKLEGTGVISLDPIVALPASRLTVHWWTPVDLRTLTPPRPACDGASDDPLFDKKPDVKTFTATLLECPQDQPRRNIGMCAEGASVELPMDELRGSAVFENAPAGRHYVLFKYPGLQQLYKPVEVARRAATDVDLEIRHFSFYGKVMRGGKPVHAKVFLTTTDPATGQYIAVLDSSPMDAPFAVAPCDGSKPVRLVPDAVPVENAAFDIELPENRISIDVVNKATGQAVPKASIRLAAMMPEGPSGSAHYAQRAGVADEAGHFVIEPVLTNRKLVVCADHPDFVPVCAPEFEMKTLREKSLRMEMEKAVKREGRVVAGRSSQGAWLVWFSADGRETETVRRFEDDGRFVYIRPHAEGETVAFISGETPLYVFRYPRIAEDAVFEVRLPAATVRSFTVTLSEASRETLAWATIQLGDLLVPNNVLGWHGMMRRSNHALKPGETITITDILETAPITVVLVPLSIAQGKGPPVDLAFLLPRQAYPRKELGNQPGVTFD